MSFERDDLTHVLRLVFNDNKGQTMTEALMLGMEQSIFFYLNAINRAPEHGAGDTHGTQT